MKFLLVLLGLSLVAQNVGATSPNAFSQRRGAAQHRNAAAVGQKTSCLPVIFSYDEAPKIRGTYISSLTQEQQASLNNLLMQSSKLDAVYDPATKSVVSMEGSHLSEAFVLGSAEDVASAVTNFVSVVGPLLGLRDAASELKLVRSERDGLGHLHARVVQRFNGITVWGTEAIVHFNAKGEVESYNGRLMSTLDLNPNSYSQAAVATQTAARTVCFNDLLTTHSSIQLSSQAQQLLNYTEPVVEQVLLPSRNPSTESARNCWHLTVRPNLVERWEYFVDCSTSEVVFKYNNTCSDGPATANASDLNSSTKTVNSYLYQSAYYLIDASRPMFNPTTSKFPNSTVGSIWTIDARKTDLTDFYNVNSTNNSWSDRSSVSAHTNSATTYEYYRTTHNRSAIDGSGSSIVSVIHVTQGGQGMDNAYWNGKLMAYGDGSTMFKPLAGAIDVAAHEMTHGVTENTCALVYLSQSGAINESMSDVFGCFVERKNWKIGEDVVEPSAFPTGALRDMADPHNGGTSINDNGWQPAHMSEYQTLPETQNGDNGGVHINSGIPNKAAYLIQNSIGMAKAEKIYYLALSQYLTKNSQFIDLRRAIIKAAQTLYSTTEMTVCGNAFDAVGILDGNATNTNHDQQAVNGTEWILLHNTNFNTDPNSLYIVKPVAPTNSDFHPISKSPLNRRPSVVDDGSFAVFVAKDNTLHYITLSINSPQESILNSNPVWDNIAVSRDGKRLAAISTDIDSSIYIFDMSKSSPTVQKFVLYSPTTAQGIRNYNIPYADAIEWDYSGKNVLFDAFNRIDNGQGDTVEYWNIGLLHAFDPAAATYSDGTIYTILPTLPDGVSAGNPTFSKNSPAVIAFDVIDDNTGSYSIVAMNTESGDSKILVANNMSLGYPSYGRLDDKVAYTTIDNQSRSIVNILPVSTDRITATGAGVFLASEAEFPVFYAVGSRPVSVQDADPLLTSIQVDPNPAQDAITLKFNTNDITPTGVEVFDMLGNQRIQMNASLKENSSGSIVLDTHALENGIYQIRLSNAQKQVATLMVIAR